MPLKNPSCFKSLQYSLFYDSLHYWLQFRLFGSVQASEKEDDSMNHLITTLLVKQSAKHTSHPHAEYLREDHTPNNFSVHLHK